ncbi:tyrosine-type recombinase/integrase [Cytophaga sp. FL35]|uniref:tyrosine-type recombinase/integrase n=1 Tax=Cytophaga sp. FL35 TaxID=1904456 RepID=UPI0016537CF8|nr:tyrosine-type recombinase/integrase [Cytophaga sp. FL35]MBC7000833.1 tyrosine-type recombinase/integrase [Cytophaga sp. FL35]
MNFAQYTFLPDTHRNKKVILVKFKYNKILQQQLRKRFPSAKWSQSKKSWYLPDLPAVRRELQLDQKPAIHTHLTQISKTNQQAYVAMQEQLMLKGYSPHTVRTYLAELKHLLVLLGTYSIDDLTPKRLKDYFLYCLKNEGLKERKMNGKINAIKFYFEQVLHRPKMFFDIPRPKKPQTLPKMLSKEEVKRLLEVTTNLKHSVALQLSYGMGLRVSEVVGLKLTDIDSERMVVHISGAKGKKDRYVPLPHTLIDKLRKYYVQYRPKEYLLEGQYGGPYAIASVQHIFKNAMKKAQINKRIGVHGLRHSYATHLLEAGADMRFIQELLGHNSVLTTQVYTKVTPRSLSKVPSPLDSL